MIVKLLTEHQMEFLSLKGDCTGSSESTLVKMPHCWEPHVAAHFRKENKDCLGVEESKRCLRQFLSSPQRDEIL